MQLKRFTSLLVVALMIASTSALAATMNPLGNDPVTGKYEGVAKSPAIGDIPITVNLKNEGGKLSGSIDTPNGPAAITSGSFADGKLTMKLDAGGAEININAKLEGDKIVGEWELAGQTGTLELKRVGGGAPATTSTPPAAAGDPVSGEWEAEADAGGQTIPFTLKLKLEGDKVTGSSESPQGSAALSNGSWKDGKLTFSLDTPNGAITMTGKIDAGKIDGDFEVSGFQGKWKAAKKK